MTWPIESPDLEVFTSLGDVLGVRLVGDEIVSPVTNSSAAVGSAGALTGSYYYSVTYVTAYGETAPWSGTASVVSPSSQRVNLTNIPIGPDGVIARRIYRTKAASVDPKDYYFVAEIEDNETTTYEDNTADGDLGDPVSWTGTNRGLLSDGTYPLLRIAGQSVSIGDNRAAVKSGYANTVVGYAAGLSVTIGRRNSLFGAYAGTAITTGYANSCFGTHAGQGVTTGASNLFLGQNSGFNGNGSGGSCNNNTGIGYEALNGTSSGLGSGNVALGYRALGNINTADQCLGLGYFAGRYANASRQMFIDTVDRSNIAGEQNSGLIYGKGESTPQAQVLHLNAPTRVGWGSSPTVSQLPSAAAGLVGYRAYVTDASVAYTSANVGSTVVGGGSNVVPVFCTGSAWVIG